MKDRTAKSFDVRLAQFLRAGVLLSTLLVTAGGAIYLSSSTRRTVDYAVFTGEPVRLRSVSGVVNEALNMSGPGFIQLGLLILIATPVARVFLSAVVFAYQRDWLYAAVTLIVLALLACGLTGA